MADLYDVHTHVGLDQAFWLRGWWPYAASARDLMAHMDTNGIDRAVCFPFTMASAYDACAFADDDRIELLSGHVPFARENLALLRECERFDGNRRLLPFAMFDPSRMVNEQVAQLRSLAGRIAGLKTQTTIIQSPILSLLDQGRPLMNLAGELGLPVLLHTSVEPRAVWAQVTDCLAIAESFPNVRFSLAHSLGFDREFLARAAQMPNVWVDCAALLAACDLARSGSPIVAPVARQVDVDYTRPEQVLVAIHEILGGCYLWGSDHPFMSWCDDDLQILHIYEEEANVLHALPEVVRISLASVAPRAWLSGEEVKEP
jgi:predicted TIM-barrel fold metal-dependent hydrolase